LHGADKLKLSILHQKQNRLLRFNVHERNRAIVQSIMSQLRAVKRRARRILNAAWRKTRGHDGLGCVANDEQGNRQQQQRATTRCFARKRRVLNHDIGGVHTKAINGFKARAGGEFDQIGLLQRQLAEEIRRFEERRDRDKGAIRGEKQP